jgi:FkbM family methyltransferase
VEQQRLTYPLTRSSIVFDVGAYQGYFTREIYKKYPCRIYAFDPVKRFYDTLTPLENVDITVLNYGIGAVSGEFKIGVRNDSSSIYLEAPEYETIHILSVVDVFAMLQVRTTGVDLIKLNIEGSEYDLLDSMLANDLMKYVKYLQIQFHHYGPVSAKYAGVGGDGPHAARRDAIREELKKTHDESWCYPFIWESWARR